jgi:uncharacterized membrane protein YkoI
MMKRWLNLTGALLLAGTAAQAQATSDQRIPIQKDVQMTSGGDVVLTPADSADIAAARAGGYWFRPSSTMCSNMDLGEAANVQMKTDLYDSRTMISPNDAKRVALCAVPGQIGSGEMEMSGNRAEYEISIIPNGKKTYSKVIVDAQTGAVLSTKQFGGARGFAGWLRESFEHKENTP